MKKNDDINWTKLSKYAWETRENAVYDHTNVGSALLSINGNIYSGCNIEQVYRNKDIHAEVCAISKMISKGEKKFIAILVVAERERFTPCGTCMDWIFQFGGANCIVGYQTKKDGDIIYHSAEELMPYYPK
jgi:cytidine deaminase